MQNQNDPTAKFYDIVSKNLKPQEITDQEIDLIQSILPDTSAKILDVGCGTGRHSVPLLELGYDVYGVEESEEMLTMLKNKITEDLSYGFINQNIYDVSASDFGIPEEDLTFDLIIMFWNTFNEIALNDEEAIALIKKLDSMLARNGKIIINSDDPAVWQVENFTYGYSTELDGIPAEYTWEIDEYDKEASVSKAIETVVLKRSTQDGVNEEDETYVTEIQQRWYTFEYYKELFQAESFVIERKKIKGNNEMYFVATKI